MAMVIPWETDSTWGYWNANGTANGTTYSSTDTWSNWNVITSATAYSYIFQNWVSYQDRHRLYRPVIQPVTLPPPPTPEQIAANRAAAEERRLERVYAIDRALTLLLETLTPEQRADYEETKHFNVRSRSGRRYRIACGRAHNVFQINKKGLAIMEFCGHVGAAVPDEDNILAQKLMIEHDEETFLRIANQISYPQPRQLHAISH